MIMLSPYRDYDDSRGGEKSPDEKGSLADSRGAARLLGILVIGAIPVRQERAIFGRLVIDC